MDPLNAGRQVTLMTDHPGWQFMAAGAWVRVLRSTAGAGWILAASDGRAVLDASDDRIVRQYAVWSDPEELPPDAPSSLVTALGSLGTSCWIRNPWLWDAISTAILRQVVRADQARRLYRRWCAAHGVRVDTPAGPMFLVPDPHMVLRLPDEAFGDAGVRFHRAALRASAAAYVECSTEWERLAPADLVGGLQNVRRIGPWTAAAAAADFTGDFSVYPYGDLAVRTWAGRAAPTVAWPPTARAFAAAWAGLAHTPRQLHTLTVLTLAWGNHASDRHPAPP
jgi:hypothetical protein